MANAKRSSSFAVNVDPPSPLAIDKDAINVVKFAMLRFVADTYTALSNHHRKHLERSEKSGAKFKQRDTE